MTYGQLELTVRFLASLAGRWQSEPPLNAQAAERQLTGNLKLLLSAESCEPDVTVHAAVTVMVVAGGEPGPRPGGPAVPACLTVMATNAICMISKVLFDCVRACMRASRLPELGRSELPDLTAGGCWYLFDH